VLDFEPSGGDEGSFAHPDSICPSALSRTARAAYAGNHSSADALDRIAAESLGASVRACLAIIEAPETNRAYVKLSPYGEPEPVRRAAAWTSGPVSLGPGAWPRPEDKSALLWVLNLSDGSHTLLDIAARSGLGYDTVRRAAGGLEEAGLLS
jgi:aminopeptidase-like protein